MKHRPDSSSTLPRRFPDRGRATLAAALLWLTGVAAAHGVDPATKAATLPLQISWALVDSSCPTSSADSVACGAYGTFIFGSSAPPGCTVRASATETPEGYPVQTFPQQTLPQTPAQSPLGSGFGWLKSLTRPKADVRTPAEAGPESCDMSQIYGPPGGPDGKGAWNAMADFGATLHSDTVAASLVATSGIPVALYPLDDPALDDLLGETVGDGHVLAQVCGLLETVEGAGVTPPAVLNMSFGRLYKPATDPTAKPCNRNTVTCQIVKVLSRLRNRHGVTAVAAAGNHQVQQFPAVIKTVLAVGSLDLAAFTSSQESKSSWEMPPGPLALFAGSALCLDCTDRAGGAVAWSPPPGSSYAASSFAGALSAALLASDPGFDPLPLTWAPTWSPTLDCFQLTPDSKTPCNAAVDKIFAQILGVAGDSCWSSGLKTPYLTVQVPSQSVGSDPTATSPSYIQVATSQAPAPPPDICGACVDGGDNKAASLAPLGGERIVDLAGASALAPQLTLEALYLRVGNGDGGDDYYLLLDAATNPDELAQLEAGYYASLKLENFPDLPADEQASIVSLTCEGSQDPYWNSTPVSIIPEPTF